MADLVAASKFTSFVLRHEPGAIGLTLDREGWANLSDLVARSDGKLTEPVVLQIVAESEKQRFALSADGRWIRANQGHSIAVDLNLPPSEPPPILFHGTATRFVDAIHAEGLTPRSRQFVHLSKDAATANTVGARHGKPVVLRVSAGEMHSDGHVFYQSENGIWLTPKVPVGYIDFDPS